MNPLPGLKALWDSETKSVQVSWDSGSMGNACFIYFVPLIKQPANLHGNSEMTVDRSVNPVALDLRTFPAGRAGKYSWSLPLFSNDIKMYYFMAYSEEYPNPINLQTIHSLLQQRRELLGSVIVGQAEIDYWVKYKRADKATQFASIAVYSDREIEGQCLNYSYQLGGKTLSQVLPLEIHKGVVKSPRFLIPAGCTVILTAAQEGLSGVMRIRAKKHGLL